MGVLPYLLAYLYGSIPFSYLIPKLFKGVDVTKYGDTNVGAMNAYYATRSLLIGLLCFLFDFSKGFLPSLLFNPLAGVFGIIGHQFSIFMAIKFKFRRLVSGLGMAATFGFLAVYAPVLIPIALLIFAAFVLLMSPTKVETWLELMQGNIETVFAFAVTAVFYVLLFNPGNEMKTAILLLLVSTSIAYARRIRYQLKQLLKL